MYRGSGELSKLGGLDTVGAILSDARVCSDNERSTQLPKQPFW